jgi:hypothetical protein
MDAANTADRAIEFLKSEAAQAMEWRTCFNGATTAEVAEAAGVTRSQAGTALAKLHRAGRVIRWVGTVEVKGRRGSRAKVRTAFWLAR